MTWQWIFLVAFSLTALPLGLALVAVVGWRTRGVSA